MACSIWNASINTDHCRHVLWHGHYPLGSCQTQVYRRLVQILFVNQKRNNTSQHYLLGDQEYGFPTIYELALVDSIKDMWNAGMCVFLFICILLIIILISQWTCCCWVGLVLRIMVSAKSECNRIVQ